MTFQFCDGMDAFNGDSSQLQYKYDFTSGSFPSTNTGRWGGGGISIGGVLRKNVSTPSGTAFYVGFNMKLGIPGSIGGYLLKLGGLIILNVDSSGKVVLVNNNTTPLATSTTALGSAGTNQWHWCEFSVTPNGSSSTASLYIDGVSQWSGTYALTAFPAGAIVSADISSGNTSGVIDDLILWDGAGTTFNTFPLGPQRITTQNPNGAGASTQFTPSTGSNWQCVSQASTNGTSNVSDTGSGNTDLYAVNSMAYTPVAINAVAVNVAAVDPSGGSTRSFTTKLRSGGTPAVASGTTRTCPANLFISQDAFVKDSGGTAWTVTTVNAAQPGLGD